MREAIIHATASNEQGDKMEVVVVVVCVEGGSAGVGSAALKVIPDITPQ